jgi:hypothetical protein
MPCSSSNSGEGEVEAATILGDLVDELIRQSIHTPDVIVEPTFEDFDIETAFLFSSIWLK